MKKRQSGLTFEQELEAEYQKAVKEGFKGIKEEYLILRNYV